MSEQSSIESELFLSVKNLSKKFVNNKKIERTVIDDINFEVKRKSFVSLFGPNGSGKTTLLNLITGILSTYDGHITFQNKDEVKVAYIFQNFSDSLLPWKTCFQNIAFPLELKGYSKKQQTAEVENIVKEVGITFPLDNYPYQCSGGQKQIVAIARALVTKPNFLVLDEPFASLDYQTRLALEDKLLQIWEKFKITIILVSHDVDEAIYLADKVLLLGGQPSTITRELIVDLPRPRTHDIINTERFLGFRKNALEVFQVRAI